MFYECWFGLLKSLAEGIFPATLKQDIPKSKDKNDLKFIDR